MVVEERLVDGARVVVETARDREIDRELRLRDAERERARVHRLELRQPLEERGVTARKRAQRREGRARVATVRGEQVEEPGRDGRLELRFGGQPALDLGSRQLAEAVDLVEHGRVGCLLDAETLEEPAQELAVVDADRERAERQLAKHAVDDRGDLRVIGERQRVLRDHVDVALVELAIASLLRALTAIDPLDLIAAEREVQLVLVLGHVARERHREIEPERELWHRGDRAGGLPLRERARGLDEVHLLLRLAARLREQHARELERGRLDREEREALEAAPDRVEHALERELLRREELEHARRSSRLNGHGARL